MSDTQQNDLEWLREKSLSGLGNYRKGSHGFRTLLALALAIGLGGFLYVQWQNRGGVQSFSRPKTNASRAATTQPEATRAAIHQPEVAVPHRQATSDLAAGRSAPPESRQPETTALVKPKATRELGREASGREQIESPSGDTGERELAIAQTFLKGGNGARDATEAAKWLWKSVAKHNAAALVLLADLYERGDGVSKSCDQAQVLLVAAAKRGSFEAGQKLKNLQTSGCM